MNIGYVRVSTLDHNLDVQMQALRKAGCKKIFREKLSGASRERSEFQRMLDQLRSGVATANSSLVDGSRTSSCPANRKSSR